MACKYKYKGNWYTEEQLNEVYSGNIQVIVPPEEKDRELNERVDNLIEKLGFSKKIVDEITDRSGVLVDATVKVDFLDKTISVVFGKAGVEELSEEAAHLFVKMLGENHPLYQAMYNRISSLPEYSEIVEDYGKEYAGKFEERTVREEAISRIIVKELLKIDEERKSGISNKLEGTDSFKRSWVEKLWDYIVRLFNSKGTYEDFSNILNPFREAAESIYDNETDELSEEFLEQGADIMYHKVPKTADLSDKIHEFIKVHNSFEKVLIENKDLPKSIVSPDPSGRTEMYREKTTKKIVPMRVSYKAHEVFKKYLGKRFSKNLNETEDSKITRETGTNAHAALFTFISRLISLDKSGLIDISALQNREGFSIVDEPFDKVVNDLLQANPNFKKEQLLNLAKFAETLVERVKAKQAEINKKTGKNGKVTILPEHFVVSSNESIGGTIDFLAIFSNGKAMLKDYKFIFPSRKYTFFDRGFKILGKSPFTIGHRKSYQAQLAGYKDILADRYGITEFDEVGIIPFQTHLKAKDKADSKEGSRFKPEITQLTTPNESNIFLKEIPFIDEADLKEGKVSGFKKLDEFILILKRKVNLLEAKHKVARGEEKERLGKEIDMVRTAIEGLYAKKDMSGTLVLIGNIINKVMGKEYNHLNITDKNDPNYVTNDEVTDYITQLEMYSHIFEYFNGYLKELSKSDNEKDKKLAVTYKDLFARYLENIVMVIAALEETRNNRIDEIATNFDVDLSLARETNWVGRHLNRISEMEQPHFRMFWEILSNKQNDVMLTMREVWDNIVSKEKELDKWAKKNNLSFSQAIEKIRSSKDGNLVGKFKPEFWAAKKEAEDTGDYTWFLKYYRRRDDWKERYERAKQKELDRLVALYSTLDKEEAYKAAQYVKDNLSIWEANNNPDNTKIWSEKHIHYYLKLKEDAYTDQSILNDSYKYMLRPENKALLDYYNMLEDYNEQARRLLKVGIDEIPINFLPWVRKNTYDRLFDNGMHPARAFKEYYDSFKYRETPEQVGVIGEDGHPVKAIPIFYTTPLRKKDGTIDYDARSKELGRSMYVFMHMAVYHNAMAEIEGDINLIHQALVTSQAAELQEDKQTGDLIREGKKPLSKRVNPSTIEIFEAFRDYYLYGVKVRGSHKWAKVIKTINSIYRIKVLSMGWIPATAAWVSGRLSVSMESAKGQYITKKNVRAANIKRIREPKLYKGIARLFEAYQEPQYDRKANLLSKKRKSIGVNFWRDLYMPYRAVDENNDDLVTNAFMENWGISSKGKLVRIDKLRKDEPNAKTISEAATINENNKIIIPGLTDDKGNITNLKLFTDIKTQVQLVNAGIKGKMSSEDIKYVDLLLAGQSIMMFKNWMPGFFAERLRPLQLDRRHDIIRQGRYITFASMFARMKEEDNMTNEAFGHYVKDCVLKNLSTIIVDLVTFGVIKTKYTRLEPNVDRMNYLYHKYLHKHGLNEEDMSFEAYMEAKKAHLRSAMVDLRVGLMLLSMILALGGDWDDDGRKNYTEYWFTRKLYMLLIRTELDTISAYNPSDFAMLLGNPLPSVRLWIDLMKTLNAAFREEAPGRVPFSYYGIQWFPGFTQAKRTFELYEQDKEFVYR